MASIACGPRGGVRLRYCGVKPAPLRAGIPRCPPIGAAKSLSTFDEAEDRSDGPHSTAGEVWFFKSAFSNVKNFVFLLRLLICNVMKSIK